MDAGDEGRLEVILEKLQSFIAQPRIGHAFQVLANLFYPITNGALAFFCGQPL